MHWLATTQIITALERIASKAPEETAGVYLPVSHPEWEKILYRALVNADLRSIPQFEVDQYDLDLALIRANGRKLDIEVDGERYHRDWDGELVRRDQLRNLRLIEMGWDILRFCVYEIRDALPTYVARVAGWAEESDARGGLDCDGVNPIAQ